MSFRVSGQNLDVGAALRERINDRVAEARATNELLGVTLLRARLIFEDDLARTLSQQLSITYVNIGVVGVDQTGSLKDARSDPSKSNSATIETSEVSLNNAMKLLTRPGMT